MEILIGIAILVICYPLVMYVIAIAIAVLPWIVGFLVICVIMHAIANATNE